MRSRIALVIGLGLLTALVGASCVVSPQPSPPEATLVGDLIGLSPGVELVAAVIGFQGGPGAVDPPEGVVLVTNLTGTDPPSIADVAADGSFVIAVPGQPGQSFRFQAKSGNTRSQPVDIEVGSSGAGISAVDTGSACLVIDPAAWVSFDREGELRSVVLQNRCEGVATLKAPRLRRGLGGFSFSSVSTVGVPAGSVATISVQAGPGSEPEDVLLLDVTAPFTATRAITLTVSDR